MASSALPLSAAIVCKNNEGTITRTLESVAPLCREIVAIDSGSTDGTIAILERFGARVVRSAWLGHVKTKQMALEACTQPWAFCIDTDEVILPDLAASIRSTLTSDIACEGSGTDGFAVNRKVFYRGKPLNHAWQPEWRCRLVRTGGKAKWQGIDPHDVLAPTDPAGRTGKLRGDLRHDSFETFVQQLGKQVHYARIQAEATIRLALEAGRPTPRGSLAALIFSPPAAFVKQLILKRAILDGWPGWLAAACAASQAMGKHVAMIEMGRKS